MIECCHGCLCENIFLLSFLSLHFFSGIELLQQIVVGLASMMKVDFFVILKYIRVIFEKVLL